MHDQADDYDAKVPDHVHLIHCKYYEHGICHQVQLECLLPPIIELLSEVKPRTLYCPGVLSHDDDHDIDREHVEERALEVVRLPMKTLVRDDHDVE